MKRASGVRSTRPLALRRMPEKSPEDRTRAPLGPAPPAQAAPAPAQDDIAQDDTTPAAGRQRPCRGRRVAAKPQETNKSCCARRTLCSVLRNRTTIRLPSCFYWRLIQQNQTDLSQGYARHMTGRCNPGSEKIPLVKQHLFENLAYIFEVWITRYIFSEPRTRPTVCL